ncbi:MAG: RNA ligase family protein [Magnetococcales bacterium]|nr:RNA ligase family protein [Magnetococcales bacterium]MBF0115186.1 RNA ligase family protein [Magnetococcales bacterium]
MSTIREEKILSEQERKAFLSHELVVEEKIDGANLGISFNTHGDVVLQNRGALLVSPFVGQWKHLSQWLSQKVDRLLDLLSDRFILFGEWCYAKHSIHYSRLPDWFIGFDIFDKNENCFLSCQRRDQMLDGLSLAVVPQIGSGIYTLQDLKNSLLTSRFCDDLAEGVYLRYEQSDSLVQRAKLVNPYFTQAMTKHHWSREEITPNRLELVSQ